MSAAELSFQTVNDVVDSWNDLRQIPNYEEVVGVKVLKRFAKIDPALLHVFNFGKKTVYDEDFFKSDRIVKIAKRFVVTLDRALNLLGPDIELLADILADLGRKHKVYGVTATHFSSMGEAIIISLGDAFGDNFTPELKDSWLQVYQAISSDMLIAGNAVRKREKKSRVFSSYRNERS